jgi:nitronate monooxygenase
LGTRFYACEEAAGHPDAKARIVAASGDDTVRSNVFDISRQKAWPAPYTGRCLINDHTRRWVGRERELIGQINEEGQRYVAAKARHDFDIAAVIAGESAGLIHDVPTAAEVIRSMVEQADKLMTAHSPESESRPAADRIPIRAFPSRGALRS